MIIAKQLKTLKQAENFQNKLYQMYDSVKLLSSPLFSESGLYRWEVSN